MTKLSCNFSPNTVMQLNKLLNKLLLPQSLLSLTVALMLTSNLSVLKHDIIVLTYQHTYLCSAQNLYACQENVSGS